MWDDPTNSYVKGYSQAGSVRVYSSGLSREHEYLPELQPVACQYDRLCGLVVRVPDYSYRGPVLDS
jgi:hypothetical protein